jgi:tRNA (cytidine/uridine-2'-O-)-methyltransferase
MDDRAVKRAGLDYWPEVVLERHLDLDALYAALPDARFVYFTKKADVSYTQWSFSVDDCLVFGRETRGLPADLLLANRKNCLKIPLLNPQVRSLNLATSVAMALGEALRQTGVFR